jgi:hypothetical protein
MKVILLGRSSLICTACLQKLLSVGTKVGRTLYRDEQLVGLVDTPELAAEIVDALNRQGPR